MTIAVPQRPSYVIEDEDDLGGRRMILNMGPQHPAMHGTLRCVMELDGEIIVKATPEIGFLHTGFEKLGESMTYHQFITVTDRANYMSAFNNNVGFALAVEEMLGIGVPPRGQVLRVILCELSRIADHILCVGLQGMDMGAFSVMLWAFEEREKVYDIFETCCGARLTTSYARIGGLSRDVPADFDAMVRGFIDRVPATIDEIETMLSRNKIFLGRAQGVGAVGAEEAVAWGLSGPVLRAAGVARDIRRCRPYLGYETYDFDVPTCAAGDSYARYQVRVAEIRESIKIIRQGLERLPRTEGTVSSVDYKVTLPAKSAVYGDMESLIHHFKLIMEGHGVRPPVGEHYSATEAPNGELGFFLASDGTEKPWRVRFRPPSFYNFQALPRFIEGRPISDAVAVLSSLNVIAGELDR